MQNSQNLKGLIQALEHKSANALIEERRYRAYGNENRAEFFKGRYTMAQFVLARLREECKD